MAVFTTLTDDEIGAFLATYDLGVLAQAKGIAEGVENTNYCLWLKSPKSETVQYILTVYEKRVKEEDLPFFLGLLQRLSSRGVPCPVPMKNRAGEIIGRLKGKAATLVSFLEGKGVKGIQAYHLAELGGHTARMHLAVGGFELSRANALTLPGWKNLLDKIGARADEIAPRLAEEIQKEYEFLSQHWPAHLPGGVIHADLFPDNVFYERERLSGIIDFYFACNDILVYELAIIINAWCFEREREFNITKAQNLLKSYNEVRPISEEEREALPILCRGAALRFLLTRGHDWLFPVDGALVTAKDPMEYVKKLKFHQSVSSHSAYGL